MALEQANASACAAQRTQHSAALAQALELELAQVIACVWVKELS